MNGQRYIYIMDRGWVLTGVFRKTTKDEMIVFPTKFFIMLDKCFVIRRWGTTKGIGQLAREGPTKDTVLDLEGNDIPISKLMIHHCIRCDEKAWSTWK